MRDYALNRTISTGKFGALTFAKRLFRIWKARRSWSLEVYDDHTLRDIGLSRMELRWAA